MGSQTKPLGQGFLAHERRLIDFRVGMLDKRFFFNLKNKNSSMKFKGLVFGLMVLANVAAGAKPTDNYKETPVIRQAKPTDTYKDLPVVRSYSTKHNSTRQ